MPNRKKTQKGIEKAAYEKRTLSGGYRSLCFQTFILMLWRFYQIRTASTNISTQTAKGTAMSAEVTGVRSLFFLR